MHKIIYTSIATIFIILSIIFGTVLYLMSNNKLIIGIEGNTLVSRLYLNDTKSLEEYLPSSDFLSDSQIKIVNNYIYYKGVINEQNFLKFKNLIDANSQNIKKVIINSEGGDTVHGRAMGDLIFDNNLDVEVENLCFSSCANYIFTAGNRKIIQKDAIVGFHGNEHQIFFTKAPSQSIYEALKSELKVAMQQSQADNLAIDEANLEEQTKKFLQMLDDEKAFYKKIGVNVALPIYAIENLLDSNNSQYFGFTLSIEDFSKFGVKNISYLGKNYFIDSNHPDKQSIFLAKFNKDNLAKISKKITINN